MSPTSERVASWFRLFCCFLRKHQPGSLAVIGTRQLAREFHPLVRRIGKYTVSLGIRMTTGYATGTDQVASEGAAKVNPSLVTQYLPNRRHLTELQAQGYSVVAFDPARHEHWVLYATRFHGKFTNMSPYVQRLLARDVGIIASVDAVIAVPNLDKPWGGGTGMGIRVAHYCGLPVLLLPPVHFNPRTCPFQRQGKCILLSCPLEGQPLCLGVCQLVGKEGDVAVKVAQ